MTSRLIDKLAAGKAPDQRDRDHLATCTRCQAAVEKAAWFDNALERLMPTLSLEPIPQAVLALPADQRLRGVPMWHRPLLAIASAAVVMVLAVFVGGQVAGLISRAGPVGSGASIAPEPSVVPSHVFDCGTPTGPDTQDVIDVDDLGNLPRVAMVVERDVVIALFAAEQDGGHAYALCTWFTDHAPPVASGSSAAKAGAPDGPVRLIGASRARADGDVVWTAYAGAADAEVSKVRVELSDGSTQLAPVNGGYFVVAWPGEAYATRFTALGPGGESLQTIGNAGMDFSDWQSP